jgi:hypothetical protein
MSVQTQTKAWQPQHSHKQQEEVEEVQAVAPLEAVEAHQAVEAVEAVPLVEEDMAHLLFPHIRRTQLVNGQFRKYCRHTCTASSGPDS